MAIEAPSGWRCIDFISDIHLQAGEPSTFLLWTSFLENTQADALFILGDLFEVWVGDDVLDVQDSFEVKCVQTLRRFSQRVPLHIMVGNRDFLMGPRLMSDAGAVMLDDPTVLVVNKQPIILTHGDAQCLDDISYQAFRKQVRGHAWQYEFLSKPLAQRQAIARDLREQSEARKNAEPSCADVDADAVNTQLDNFHALHMVHGHTHQPAVHNLGHGKTRSVLSDWAPDSNPPRGDVLRLQKSVEGAWHWTRLTPSAASRPLD
jgi:UDP-2,3-diacylglucosamine hydrolase